MGKKTGIPEFGKQLRVLRKSRGLSQEKLAGHADLHYKFIGEIERGISDIRLSSLIKLAKAFDLEPVDFFALIFHKEPLPSEALQVIDVVLQISRRKDRKKLQKLKTFVKDIL
ncbi:MAG: helix-turn-helix transcriptional regulator [bacterium]|nr:helix-turn-helix transcriptional regulator [bacterium]